MKATITMSMALLTAGAVAPVALAQVAIPRAQSASAVFARPAYLGIGAQDIDAERAKALKLKDVRGAEVTSVTPDSPAAKAGIKDGDVIVEFNGQPVEGTDQLARLVRETPVGRQVRFGLWRAGAPVTVTATMEQGKRVTVYGDGGTAFAIPELPKMPEMPYIDIPKFQMLTGNPMLGIMGEPLGQQEQLADFFGVKEGVLVKSVTKGTAAEKAGIKAGDVIVKVDEKNVNTTGEITGVLRAVRGKTTITVIVVRAKKEMPITVTLDAPQGRTVKAGYLFQPGKGFKLAPVRVLKLSPNDRII
jgi:serine protease Do